MGADVVQGGGGVGLLRLRWFAVKLSDGDFAAVEADSGRLMFEGEATARDHRTVALDVFRALPGASHVFTVAAGVAAAGVVCWRRSALLGALGELDAPAGGVAP